MSSAVNMTSGKPIKLMTVFALPLMFGNAFQQLYTLTDTAIVGRGVGMDALAALGTVDWLTWMLIGLAQGLTQGFAVPMAQQFGRNDFDDLKKTIGASARLSAILSVACVLVSELLLPLFLRLLHVPDDLYGMAYLYASVIFAGIPAVIFYNLTASVLRSVGDSRTPFVAVIISSVSNIVLDLLTVFVFGWGIAGAAAATVFSQLVSGTICASVIAKNPVLRFGRKDLAKDGKLDLTLIGFGLPIAAQNIIIAVGGIAVQSVVNRFDVGFIAGFTATNKLYGILEIAALSYGFAVITYTGQNYGAGHYKRIKEGVRSAVVTAVFLSIAIGILMIVFGRGVTGLFISAETEELAELAGETAYRYLFTMCAALPILYMLYVFRSALQGIGNTLIPMVSGIVELFMRVAVALAVSYTGFRNGIFFGEIGAWVGATLILSYSYYASERKMMKKMKNDEKMSP